jgi:hypothetical protein
MTIIAPLNLEYLLINTLAGTTMIFVGLALLFIVIYAGKFRMSGSVLGMIIALFGILLMAWAGWLYVIVIIIGGLLVGYTISRFQR